MSLIMALSDGMLAVLLIGGGGLVCAPPLRSWNALERWVAGMVLAGGLIYAWTFGSWVMQRAVWPIWGPLAAFALIGFLRRSEVRNVWRDPTVRSAAIAWIFLTAWSGVWMSQIVSFSGGGWAGDWFEHYQRACFFLTPLPLDTPFLAAYQLPARPPLANVIVAGIITSVPGSFAGYQVIIAGLSTLIVFPLVLFVHRWAAQPQKAISTLTLLLMLNPMVVQNITFPWTKLFTGFWVLAGWYFIIRGSSFSNESKLRAVGWTALALGMVTHYSAGPWVIVITASYAAWWWRTKPRPAIVREIITLGIVFGLGLGTWLLWSISHYGWSGTTGATTTVSAWDQNATGGHLGAVWRNISNTLIPFPFRNFDRALLNQSSAVGYFRDVCFSLYQVNLPGAFGLGGASAMIICLFRGRAAHRFPTGSSYWWPSASALIVLGIAVHTPPDNWGLAHICLVPLVALGIAGLASGLPTSRRIMMPVFVFALTDTVLGIVLHHGLEAWWWPSWWAGSAGPSAIPAALSSASYHNLGLKLDLGLRFLSDLIAAGPALALSILAGILALAFAQWWRINGEENE